MLTCSHSDNPLLPINAVVLTDGWPLPQSRLSAMTMFSASVRHEVAENPVFKERRYEAQNCYFVSANTCLKLGTGFSSNAVKHIRD
jgi:hypothetical protein